jgi:hypothetical protein
MLQPDQILKLAEAVRGIPDTHPLWTSLLLLLEDRKTDAVDLATELEISEEKRSYHAGRSRVLLDLLAELRDLRTDEWKKWPAVEAYLKRRPTEGEE